MTKCDNCGKFNPIINLEYMKRALCKRCFSELFEKKVRRIIRRGRLIKREDEKIAVALSGGINSSTLLKILHKLSKKAPRSELIAISIEYGSENDNLRIAEEFCNELGIGHYVFSLKKKTNMNELLKFLNEKALELKVDKIALGCSLEDEIQEMLVRFIQGDFDKMGKVGGMEKNSKKIIVPIIKPLKECPENEILTYAKINKVKFYHSSIEILKKEDSFKKEIREIIEKIEKKHPGTKFQLLRSMDELSRILREK